MTIKQALEVCDDASEMLKVILNVDETYLFLKGDKNLSATAEKRFNRYVEKRKQGIPLAYVIKRRGFWKSYFYVTQRVLIPQPDTELLVEKASEALLQRNDKKLTILDMCTGSGCVGISLANELAENGKDVELTLSDISEKVCNVCSKNVDKLLNKNVKANIVVSDLFDELPDQRFDCIVANPPYIGIPDLRSLPPDVRHEPILALFGGDDGLDLIEAIAEQGRQHLTDKGLIFCEIGYRHGPKAKALFEKTLNNVEIFKDLGMCDRVVKASV